MTTPNRDHLYSLLGDLPPRSYPVSSTLITEEDHDTFILEKLMLDLNGTEPVPAYFARPKNSPGPWPTIVYHHQHAGDYDRGKDELLLGRDTMQSPAYGKTLTDRNYAVLAIDAWMFGERSGMTESETFKLMLWNGKCLWGMMAYDAIKAVDYALTRKDVIPNRIGTLGMSMGSTTAWWLAALDPRIKVCVDICCLTDYQSFIDARHLDRTGLFYFVPGLLKHFTSSQINALTAPRPHLSLAGNYDRLTPALGLDRLDADLKQAYTAAGAPNAWQMFRQNTGHRETAAMRAKILTFLQVWL